MSLAKNTSSASRVRHKARACLQPSSALTLCGRSYGYLGSRLEVPCSGDPSIDNNDSFVAHLVSRRVKWSRGVVVFYEELGKWGNGVT